MDPPLFLPYSQAPAGLPQESKLLTYMNHSPSTPTGSLNQAMDSMNLEPSPPADEKQFMFTEFVPISYYSPTNILPESPENHPPVMMPLVPNSQILHNQQIHLNAQAHLNTPVHHKTHIYQENVGGTTYFYSTNEFVNPGFNPAMGAECLGAMALPYAPQMYVHEMAPPYEHMTAEPRPKRFSSSSHRSS